MTKSIIIAVLFWSFIAIVILLSVGITSNVVADSDTATTLTTIGNATPTVGTITRDSTITLSENGYSAIAWATSTITDLNGCSEVSFSTSVVAVFYDTSAPVATSCSSNGRNCYPNASTTCTAGTCAGGSTNVVWSCHAHPWHYANDSSGWKWYIAASDATDTGSSTSDTVTISPLLALDVTETQINYGALSLNTLSSQSTTTVLNTGNDIAMDVGVQENASFTCTVGTIASDYQRFSQSSGFEYSAGAKLWSTSTTIDADIVQGSNGSETPSEPAYWLLTTPSSGVSGSCQGTNYLEAL